MELHHISPAVGVVDYTTGKELHLSSWISRKGTKNPPFVIVSRSKVGGWRIIYNELIDLSTPRLSLICSYWQSDYDTSALAGKTQRNLVTII